MIKLADHRYFLRRNILTLIGVCLSAYFCWHIAAGERSVLRLNHLQEEVQEYGTLYDGLHTRRVALEADVVKLRPGRIDRDLLEERVRAELGYARPGDRVILYSASAGKPHAAAH